MSRVLGRDQCKSAAEIVNKDLSEELIMVRQFHKEHCSGTLGNIEKKCSRTLGNLEKMLWNSG
jgi:hypothetical protein